MNFLDRLLPGLEGHFLDLRRQLRLWHQCGGFRYRYSELYPEQQGRPAGHGLP